VHPAFTILAKDLRLRLRDRSVVLFAVVVPLGLTVLFSFVFPDVEGVELRAAVLDEDGGAAADGFVAQLLPALEEEGLVDLHDLDDEAAVRAALDTGDLDAAWLIPAGFSGSVAAGGGGEIDVLVNADRPVAAEVARAVAEGYGAQLDRITLAVATTATAAQGQLDAEALEQVAAAAAAADPLITVAERITADRQLDPISYLAAGMAAFFVFFTVQWGVNGLLEEGQLGTMPRLLAAPMSPAAIHLGKALGAAILGLTSMTVLGVTSAWVLGAEWGDPRGVAVLIVALVAAALGVMALVGSFARTAEQANNYQSTVAVVLGLLGGVFFPLPFTGGLATVVTAISPHRWFLAGLGDLVGSDSWTVVLPAAGAIVAFGIVAAVPAVVRMRRAATW
jgi:ABC-2 type transport system permease protein